MSEPLDADRSVRMWDTLHAAPRFRPRYPSEHVVRFLVSGFPDAFRPGSRVLDIGVGGGRHVHLMCELGFQAAGCDISEVALGHAERWLSSSGFSADLRTGSMWDLPFESGSFDGAVAYGVFNYGDRADFGRAVAELQRVLRLGGQALVVTRATDDYRFGKGQDMGRDTWRLEIEDTNEAGSVQHFLSEAAVREMFASFSSVTFEKTMTTRSERTAMDSDWIVRLVK